MFALWVWGTEKPHCEDNSPANPPSPPPWVHMPRISTKKWGQTQMSTIPFEQIHLNTSEYIWIHLDTFKYIRIHLSTFESDTNTSILWHKSQCGDYHFVNQTPSLPPYAAQHGREMGTDPNVNNSILGLIQFILDKVAVFPKENILCVCFNCHSICYIFCSPFVWLIGCKMIFFEDNLECKS